MYTPDNIAGLEAYLACVFYEIGLADKGKCICRLQPLSVNYDRSDVNIRRHYLAFINDTPVAFMTIGIGLDDLYHKAVEFSNACPAISCKCLFYRKHNNINLLAQEYFQGCDLENGWKQKVLNEQQIIFAVKMVLKSLNTTLVNSSNEAREHELKDLIDCFSDKVCWDSFDRTWVANIYMPLLKESLLTGTALRRWTNGDLITRNIMIDIQNNVRLVDYEFAMSTHFYLNDYVRLMEFTDIPKALLLKGVGDYQALSEGSILFFWICHAILSAKVVSKDKLRDDASMYNGYLSYLRSMIIKESPSIKSFFMQQIINEKIKSDTLEAQFEVAKLKYTKIESELRKLLTIEQNKVIQLQSSDLLRINNQIKKHRIISSLYYRIRPFLKYLSHKLFNNNVPTMRTLANENDIKFSIDSINNIIVSHNLLPIAIRSTSKYLTVYGWIIDTQANDTLKSVNVYIDNKIFTCGYGIIRTDVADKFKSPNYKYSGFKCDIPVEEIKAGKHKLFLQGFTKANKEYRLAKQYVLIDMNFKRLSIFLRLIKKLFQYLRSPRMTLQKVLKANTYVKRYGVKIFLLKCLQIFCGHSILNSEQYKIWIKENEPDYVSLQKQREKEFLVYPKISIIVPTFNARITMLISMLNSVVSQTYSNWELCVVDGGSKNRDVKRILSKYAASNAKIRVKFLSINKGITGNTNEAISMATGDFIAFLDHDDILAPFALFEIVNAIQDNPDVKCLYSDEDKISGDGKKRYNPFFKPDFAPDTLRSYNYICHFFVCRKDIGDSIGWVRKGFDGAQDYDFILRLSEKTQQFVHIAKILYHWRAHSNSTALSSNNKISSATAGKKCLEEHLQRIGSPGSVSNVLNSEYYDVQFPLSFIPLVSIIIPNKNQSGLLKKCISSIMEKSSYRKFEIIVIENKSTEQQIFDLYNELKKHPNVKVIEWDYEFNFSALNNFAVQQAEGEIVLFLNNDVEVISVDWIERMLQHAIRKDVGAVGAMLYYPDDTIQHAGVIVGLGGVAGHSHKCLSRYHSCYTNRLQIVQNLSAVTAACLMMRKEVFTDVGGFDEDLVVAFNDVDLCLRIRGKGYLIVWTPYAELYHHESKTRGLDNTTERIRRFNHEISIIHERWAGFLAKGDPYYNCNLTTNKEDFSIKD